MSAVVATSPPPSVQKLVKKRTLQRKATRTAQALQPKNDTSNLQVESKQTSTRRRNINLKQVKTGISENKRCIEAGNYITTPLDILNDEENLEKQLMKDPNAKVNIYTHSKMQQRREARDMVNMQ